MRSAYSIYEAKARLSELLRNVKKGRESVITERGYPIAKVVPFRSVQAFEDRLKELSGRGVILPRKAVGRLPPGIRRPGGLRRFIQGRE